MTTLSGVIETFILGLLGITPDPAQIASAQAAIRIYRDDATMGVAWTGLDKKVWCSRIEALLADPTPINQNPTGYCMPAACLYVLFKRAPAAMANFCVGLARDGQGSIGNLTITMTKELRDYGVPAYAAAHEEGIDPVDYILMLAMQNQMSVTNITAPDDYASRPGFLVRNVTGLLSATNLFSAITSKDNPAIADLQNLDPKTDVLMFGDVNFFSTSPNLTGHVVVLVPPIVKDGGIVTFHFWSWGVFKGNQTLDIEGNAYVKQVSEAAFSANISTAVFATAQF